MKEYRGISMLISEYKSYEKCVKYLYSLERVGIKYDLKNIKSLLRFLGNPEKNFKSVHIAGTNGKGTVASIINSYLIELKYKTGLYTSPHIKDFRERILVNGKMIPQKYVIDFTNKIYDLTQKILPSFFEATTAMAFQYFSDCGIEYAVIEAGLGGRLDSTNILKPELSIITSISIDHTEYLGNTVEKIAFEKAGIIKKGVPVVTGKLPAKAIDVIKNIAVSKNAEVVESQNERIWIPTSIDMTDTGLAGKYQQTNLLTSVVGIREFTRYVDFSILKKSLRNLRKNSGYYGRFEVIKEKPTTIIDVSHNAEGIRNIKENLKLFKYKNLFIVFGMMADKEHRKCIKELEKCGGKIILTKINYKRSAVPERLYKAGIDKSKFVITQSVKEAKDCANKKASKQDLILYTGSFFLISELLNL